MMLPVSDVYRPAVAAGHEPYARVEVWRQGKQVHAGVPILKGKVDATLTSRIARKLTMTVANEWYPVSTGDLLAPFGNELRAFRGVAYGNGAFEEFPVFRGRITGTPMQDDGTVQISADDRGADVAENEFEVPEASKVGATNTAEIKRLIRQGVRDATFGPSDEFGTTVPALVWDTDRAKACDDLATAAGALWYPLADGRYVIRAIPWTRKAEPVLTLSDGPGGQVVKAVPARSRTDIYNVVTVVGGRADGAPPVQATVRDDNPASATYWAGPFGVRSIRITVQEALTQAQARGIAQTYLRRYIALNETWTLAIVPDGSVELGDVVALDARSRQVVQVITGFTMPLTIKDGHMQVKTRALTPVIGLIGV